MAVVAALLTAACLPLADALDDRLNPVGAGAPTAPPPSHRAAHARPFVADLHADTLMWGRDLLAPAAWGHVDVPRLVAGGVGLQVFAVVTKTPPERPLGDGRHCVPADGLNTTGLLSVVQLRDPATWFDLRARALLQAERLHRAVERSATEGPAQLLLVRHLGDLAQVVAASAAPRDRPLIGVVLGLEGANWVGGPAVGDAEVRAEVRRLFDAGFRTFALTHRFDNALAGSSEGCDAGPLTPQGAAALDETQRLGMVVDLAHISPAALRDVLPRLRRPPIVSHTGAQASCTPPCYPPRDLSDAELSKVARAGGVIGIGFWPEAIGPGGRSAVVQAFGRAAVALARPEPGRPALDPWDHLAFGSDFDGAVEVPFDAAGLPGLTWALSQGVPDVPPVPPGALARIAGVNVCRVLAANLPYDPAAPGATEADRQRACALLRTGAR